MRRSRFLVLTTIIAVFALLLAACSNSSNVTPNPANEINDGEDVVANESAEVATVEITDVHGTVTVPVNPQNVVALDNRTFETLSDWGIELAAVPKGVMTADSPYVDDESVLDIGNHREPNLEILAAAEPELVIIGQRFAEYYDDIKALVPNAAVIDLNFDVSETASRPGDNLINGLINSTLTLGKIFDKTEEAEQLVTEFEKAIENAKSAYNGSDTVMSVIVSGGNIGFSAPGSGRVWGPMYDILVGYLL